ncbi:MAG: carbamoyltransferase family protein [Pseudonocardia sp.]
MTTHPQTGAPVENAEGHRWVVGLNHGAHDASCALLDNGRLVVTVEQERLSRRKRAVDESPGLAMRHCLDSAGITLSDVDVVALGSDHDALAGWLGLDPAQRAEVLPFDAPERLFPVELFGDRRPRAVVPVAHHVAHGASAFWPSGFDEAAVLVIDAMGEDTATSIGQGRGENFEVLETFPVDTSLGFFYETASAFAGLGRNDAGKLMGLASYGRRAYSTGLGFRDGEIVWDGVSPARQRGRALIEERAAGLREQFARTCYPFTARRGESIMAYADFAASVQADLEDTVLALARRAREITGLPRLVLAGGVALNCTVNGRLADSAVFDEIYVQPMAHDAGVALGAAIAATGGSGTPVARGSRMEHAYWGPDLDPTETPAAFAAAGLLAEELPYETLLPRVAQIIAAGGIVAWGQGRAEVGPRALGARSMLADPRDRESLRRLNQAKGREMWRPLAPSVQRERFDDYFEGTPSPFMIVAARVRPEVRQLVPAVVHVDGSARPQAVDREHNPAYHGLLSALEQRTGIPVVVNTSLNVAEEPIASSASDILGTFQKSGADAVVIGRHLGQRA